MANSAVATKSVDDPGLIARARAGDEAALTALVSENHGAAYEVAYRILGDPDAAADATQNAFMKALQALDSFRGDASFKTWLLRITANEALTVGRTTTRRGEVSLDAVAGQGSEGADPASQAMVRTEAERVEEALNELPEKQRLAVSLRINQDLSHREIGEILGSSEGTARVNYHLGIKRLREILT